MKKFLEIIKNKWLIKGTSTLILVAIVIACYIVLNMLVDKIKMEDLDFTEKKLYSLSDETKSKVGSIENEITIDLVNMESQQYIKDYAKKYELINKNIKVEEINDLSSRVDLKTKYDLTDTDYIIIVKSGEREKVVKSTDLTTFDYNTYKQVDRTEEAITNAIVEITLNRKPKIYIFAGNTYYSPATNLASVISRLKDDANEVETLDILSKGSMPEDCDLLVITTLKSDLSDFERDKILDYTHNGGKLLILTSQNILEENTPNFDQILAEYGIKIDFGAVFEQDASKMLSNAPELILEEATASFMSDIDMSIKACLIDAGRIDFESQEKLDELGIEYEPIIQTSEKSYVRTNFNITSYSRTEQDLEEASYIVGAKITKRIDDEKTSEIIVFSNEQFASDMKMPINNQYYMYAVDLYNNKDVILNSCAYLTERQDTISIRKTDETQNYTVTDKQNTIIELIIFILPVVIIIVGIVIWQVRRRRK